MFCLEVLMKWKKDNPTSYEKLDVFCSGTCYVVGMLDYLSRNWSSTSVQNASIWGTPGVVSCCVSDESINVNLAWHIANSATRSSLLAWDTHLSHKRQPLLPTIVYIKEKETLILIHIHLKYQKFVSCLLFIIMSIDITWSVTWF